MKLPQGKHTRWQTPHPNPLCGDKTMATTDVKIIDGDGHIGEDISAIIGLMPPPYKEKYRGRDPYPPLDHLHSSIYSSDFPHEVNNEFCKQEIRQVLENGDLTGADKEAVLQRNAERFYNLGRVA